MKFKTIPIGCMATQISSPLIISKANIRTTQVVVLVFLNISFLILLSLYLSTLLTSSSSDHDHDHDHHAVRLPDIDANTLDPSEDEFCAFIRKLPASDHYMNKCSYVKNTESCRSQGYVNYLVIFYCYLGGGGGGGKHDHPWLGYALLSLWLLILFYLLGNTASQYFCSSLEGLSKLLRLSPTIAGVTLLSLGNGAPDVFSSLVSFIGTAGVNADVGFNGILGGSFFISSVVVGLIAISGINSQKLVSVDRSSFVRDACFLLFTIGALLVVFVLGRINLSGAIGFTSIYAVYVCAVYFSHYEESRHGGEREDVNMYSCSDEENGGLMKEPLLMNTDDNKQQSEEEEEDGKTAGLTASCQEECSGSWVKLLTFKGCTVLLLPLWLPRRLTIPVVSEEGWSKPLAVCSAILSPIFLSVLWSARGNGDLAVIYVGGFGTGVILGLASFLTLTDSGPPKNRLLGLWLIGGFCMTVAWTYTIAEELVALLLDMGRILGISPQILGLTLLAWGNSLGDLITNLAIANKGGPGGIQTAVSGCYAGPVFNMVLGLGLPLVALSWSVYPDTFKVSADSSLFVLVGFLAGGILWALVMVLRRGMRLDRVVGCGLLAIYLCFLCLRAVQEFGLALT